MKALVGACNQEKAPTRAYNEIFANLCLKLDSRMKFVAHERFQYVMLKKFGETPHYTTTAFNTAKIISIQCNV